jgi:hypothetical protein
MTCVEHGTHDLRGLGLARVERILHTVLLTAYRTAYRIAYRIAYWAG